MEQVFVFCNIIHCLINIYLKVVKIGPTEATCSEHKSSFDGILRICYSWRVNTGVGFGPRQTNGGSFNEGHNHRAADRDSSPCNFYQAVDSSEIHLFKPSLQEEITIKFLFG
mgnify:CR=1 FL=1